MCHPFCAAAHRVALRRFTGFLPPTINYFTAVATPTKAEGLRHLRHHTEPGHGCRGSVSQESGPTAVIENEQEECRKACRQNRARPIKKAYESDLLVCPGCLDPREVVSFAEDVQVIKGILLPPEAWGHAGTASPCRHFFLRQDCQQAAATTWTYHGIPLLKVSRVTISSWLAVEACGNWTRGRL